MSGQASDPQLLYELVANGFSQPHTCKRCESILLARCPGQEVFRIPIGEIEGHVAGGCPFWLAINEMLQYRLLDKSSQELLERPTGWSRESPRKTDLDPSLIQISVGFADDYFLRLKPPIAPNKLRIKLGVVEHVRNSAVLKENWMDFVALRLPGLPNTNVGVNPPNPNPASEPASKLGRSWLSFCKEKHDCGFEKSPESMPKRLLKVRKMDDSPKVSVSVVESSSIGQTPYAALSYCWGSRGQKLLLTQDTYELLKTGIDVQDLQPTIRDAATVAATLEISYLWVDALCILQDNNTDKASEIPRMSKIYGNACLTIVASRAAAVEDGFLNLRPLLASSQPNRSFQVTYNIGPEKHGLVIVPIFKEENEPWESRAWTLQERLFSKRVLKYGTLNTTYICHGGRERDVYAASDGWKGLDGELTQKRKGTGVDKEKSMSDITQILQQVDFMSALDSSSVAVELGKMKREDVLKSWYELVGAYSKRNITVPLDRLPAMSGIAQSFASALQDNYFSGHWQSNLAYDLMWTRFSSQSPERPSQYTGPSWSWAGYPGGAYYNSVWRSSTADPEFAILSCRSELMYSEAPFGAVKSSCLQVRGYLAPVDLKFLNEVEALGLNSMLDRTRLEEELKKIVPSKSPSPEHLSRECLDMWMDYRDKDTGFPQSVFLLVIAHDNGDPAGLILLRNENGDFSRLGVFRYVWSTLRRTDQENDDDFEQRRSIGIKRWWGNRSADITMI